MKYQWSKWETNWWENTEIPPRHRGSVFSHQWKNGRDA